MTFNKASEIDFISYLSYAYFLVLMVGIQKSSIIYQELQS